MQHVLSLECVLATAVFAVLGSLDVMLGFGVSASVSASYEGHERAEPDGQHEDEPDRAEFEAQFCYGAHCAEEAGGSPPAPPMPPEKVARLSGAATPSLEGPQATSPPPAMADSGGRPADHGLLLQGPDVTNSGYSYYVYYYDAAAGEEEASPRARASPEAAPAPPPHVEEARADKTSETPPVRAPAPPAAEANADAPGGAPSAGGKEAAREAPEVSPPPPPPEEPPAAGNATGEEEAAREEPSAPRDAPAAQLAGWARINAWVESVLKWIGERLGHALGALLHQLVTFLIGLVEFALAV